MSDTDSTEDLTFHCATGGATIPDEDGFVAVRYRGDTFSVTPKLREASTGRDGISLLDLLDDPSGQIERYGEIRFVRGLPTFEVIPEAPSLAIREKAQEPPFRYAPTVSIDYSSEHEDSQARAARF